MQVLAGTVSSEGFEDLFQAPSLGLQVADSSPSLLLCVLIDLCPNLFLSGYQLYWIRALTNDPILT